MSLLVIYFPYTEGRDGGLVVKEVAVADSQTNGVSSFVFKKPHDWEKLPEC